MTTQDAKINSAVETYSATAIAADIDLRTVRDGYATDGEAKCPKFITFWDTGNCVVEYPSGETDTIPVLVAGVTLPVQPAKILNAGTTITTFTAGYN